MKRIKLLLILLLLATLVSFTATSVSAVENDYPNPFNLIERLEIDMANEHSPPTSFTDNTFGATNDADLPPVTMWQTAEEMNSWSGQYTMVLTKQTAGQEECATTSMVKKSAVEVYDPQGTINEAAKDAPPSVNSGNLEVAWTVEIVAGNVILNEDYAAKKSWNAENSSYLTIISPERTGSFDANPFNFQSNGSLASADPPTKMIWQGNIGENSADSNNDSSNQWPIFGNNCAVTCESLLT